MWSAWNGWLTAGTLEISRVVFEFVFVESLFAEKGGGLHMRLWKGREGVCWSVAVRVRKMRSRSVLEKMPTSSRPSVCRLNPNGKHSDAIPVLPFFCVVKETSNA